MRIRSVEGCRGLYVGVTNMLFFSHTKTPQPTLAPSPKTDESNWAVEMVLDHGVAAAIRAR